MKMDNIMVEEYECSRLNIQIIDFGFAVVKGFSDYFNERCGTVGYLAPEIVNEEEYNELCDIFSLS
jgi:serine/threonine protein kinase